MTSGGGVLSSGRPEENHAKGLFPRTTVVPGLFFWAVRGGEDSVDYFYVSVCSIAPRHTSLNFVLGLFSVLGLSGTNYFI